MYFINGIPYTFDEVEESYTLTHEIIEWANDNTSYDIRRLVSVVKLLVIGAVSSTSV